MADEPIPRLGACLEVLETLRRSLDQLGFLIRQLVDGQAPQAGPDEPSVLGGKSGEFDEYLTIKQAAKVVQVTRRWLQANWKKIPGAGKFGRKQVRIPRAGLLKYMQTCRDND